MKIFITFGQSHIHKIGNRTYDKDCVAVIDAADEEAGRRVAFEHFGDKWFTSYADINKVAMGYYPRGLIELETERQIMTREGLLFVNGKMIPIPLCDITAIEYGFIYVERFIKALTLI